MWKKISEIKQSAFNEYNELFDKLNEMSFDKAYNTFGGSNLESDAYYDNAKEMIRVSLKFDVTYKNITTTVFSCGENNNECELWECCLYKVGEHCEIGFDVSAHDSIDEYGIYTNDNIVIELKQ